MLGMFYSWILGLGYTMMNGLVGFVQFLIFMLSLSWLGGVFFRKNRKI